MEHNPNFLIPNRWQNKVLALSSYITPELLMQIMPTLPRIEAVGWADAFATVMAQDAYDEVLHPDVFEEFIAQVAHESGYLTRLTEGLGYSAKRLREVWPSRFPTMAIANKYAYNPQGLANKVYANRMGNGNEASGDGYMFRGGGLLQLTGRGMYTKFAKFKGLADPMTVANKVRTDKVWALESACWVFIYEKGLLDEAIDDKFITITKAINGGTIGLADRVKVYDRTKKVLALHNVYSQYGMAA